MTSAWRRLRRDEQAGYVAVLAALFASTLFFGLAAIGVDVSRWYMETERLQKTADAAALAGVTYMPDDFSKARAKALDVAQQNGYVPGTGTTIAVEAGTRASQLKVTITQNVENVFGSAFGAGTSAMTRSALADYTAPAPIGSPCNVFGNEPTVSAESAKTTTSNAGPASSVLPPNTDSSLAQCTSTPAFWAGIEGPRTDKVQGDRSMTSTCASNSPIIYGCASNAAGAANSEYDPLGHFLTVHVEAAAANQAINIQLYDPGWYYTGATCNLLTSGNGFVATNNMNPYAPDATTRYQGTTTANFCTGDAFFSTADPPATTFVLRNRTDSLDPMDGTVLCQKQYAGYTNYVRTAALTSTDANYNPELARLFHQWTSMCTFTPPSAGDYYLQVRTNVSLAGTGRANATPGGTALPSLEYAGTANTAGAATGNSTAGEGSNMFAVRAVPVSTANRAAVSVSGYSRMPVFQNATGSTAQFNLIRAETSTSSKYINFEFFDAGDATGSGTIRVIAPNDATGSIKSGSNIAGCRYATNNNTLAAVSNCTADISNSANNGQVGRMQIPIPSDYSCKDNKLAGCWFRVEVKFQGASQITDFTTWDASIGGTPVRILQ